MNPRRIVAASVAALALVLSLTACFGLPSLPGTGGGDPISVEDGSSLENTTWAGTDSDGDDWEMTFQADGTVGLELNGNTFDDATDVWSVDNGTLNITIALDSGPCTFTGPYVDGSSSIDLEGTVAGHDFTLTLDKR